MAITKKTKKAAPKKKKLAVVAPEPVVLSSTKNKKAPKLSFYKDLMDAARLTIKTFIATAKKGNKHGWREPGPAQWDLQQCSDFKDDMSTVPDDEKVLIVLKQAELMFISLLVDGFRKGKSYRKTNKLALENLRAFYSANIKPELVRIEAVKKTEAKALAKEHKAAAKRAAAAAVGPQE